MDLEKKLDETSSARGIKRDEDIPQAEVSVHKLRLMEALEEEPEVRQMDLAVRLGVTIGTVNWHLKHLAAKGYVKIKKIGRWQWSYLLTPQGMAEKTRVTRAYVRNSMQLYWETKKTAQDLLQEVKRAGYKQVQIEGDNDLVDVCRLTCMEQGIAVVSPARSEASRTTSHGLQTIDHSPRTKNQELRTKNHDNIPVLCVEGRELSLNWPKQQVGID